MIRMTSCWCVVMPSLPNIPLVRYGDQNQSDLSESQVSGFYFRVSGKEDKNKCTLVNCSCCAISCEPKLERVSNNIQTAAAAGYKSRRLESEPPDCDLLTVELSFLTVLRVQKIFGVNQRQLILLENFAVTVTRLCESNHGSTTWIDVDVVRSQC